MRHARAAKIRWIVVVILCTLTVSSPSIADHTPDDANCPATRCVNARDMSINNFSILTEDPAFERPNVSTKAWNVQTGPGSAWTFTTVGTAAHSGTRVAQRTWSGAASTRTLDNALAAEAIPGDNYLADAWFKSAPNTKGTASIAIRWLTTNGSLVTQNIASTNVTAAWKRVQIVGTTPAGAAYARLRLQVNGQTAGTWSADDARLIRRTPLNELAFDPATQTELNTYKTQADRRFAGTRAYCDLANANPRSIPTTPCRSSRSILAPSGGLPDIAIGADGNPIVSHTTGSGYDVLVTACTDPLCSDSRTTTPVVTPQAVDATSIAIGNDGYPVIGAAWGGDLYLVKCQNQRCEGSVEPLYLVDSGGGSAVGDYVSVAIGDNGNPVMSYYDKTLKTLKLARCNDPACATAGIRVMDDGGDHDVGAYTSIAIGADGAPVMSYYNESAQSLRVVKCGDWSCAGAYTIRTVDDDPVADVGRYSSIAIGFDGNPVISYQAADSLRVTKCTEPTCGLSRTTTTVDDGPDRGLYTSIAIGFNGNPVISHYYDAAIEVRFTACNDPACAGRNESTVAVDFGSRSSMAIGVDGHPIISYRRGFAGFLSVARPAVS